MELITIIFLVLFIIALALAVAAYFFASNLGQKKVEKKYSDLKITAEDIINDAKREGERRQKELISEAKSEINTLKQENEKEIQQKKTELSELEKKIEQREDRLDARSLSLDKREDALVIKENKIEDQKQALDKRSNKIEELIEEQEFWFNYAKKHVSKAFDGIKEIMEEQKRCGGLVVVVSHSYAYNILKDYEYNNLPNPDMIFGWEEPREERKPSPTPLFKIMDKYNLNKEDILVIDDLKPGLDMANSAGVNFAAAGWCSIEENEKYMRQHAQHYCKSVDDLKKLCF